MVNQSGAKIGAVVLAAGLSRRMGRPKMILPWGESTVIRHVASVLMEGGVCAVVVVTGGAREEVESALRGLPVTTAFNPDYENGEMLASVQVGIRALPPGLDAFLLALGDQPQIEPEVVRQVIAAYQNQSYPLVVPSFEMRRGHPWLVDRALWNTLLAYQPPKTMRDFLHAQRDGIHYVNVTNPSILMDLDTPEDYVRQVPKKGT